MENENKIESEMCDVSKLKYRLSSDEVLKFEGKLLQRIIYNDGSKGGWIEKYSNLSQEGNCKVLGEAKVYDNAEVKENAEVSGNATIYQNATIRGKSFVLGNATVKGYAYVTDSAKITDNALICDNAYIYESAVIKENAKVHDDAKVHGNITLRGNVKLKYSPDVIGYDTEIGGDSVITSYEEYLIFKDWWSLDSDIVWTRNDDMFHTYDFYGTGEELIKEYYKRGDMDGDEAKRIVEYINHVKVAMENV